MNSGISFLTKLSILFAVFVGIAPGQTITPASYCPIEVAPVPKPFKATPPNLGIQPQGFVGIAGGVQVLHGVDVSKWQDGIDFFRTARCGGTFAYIRISAGANVFNEIAFSSLWGQARAAGLMVGPYHHLTVAAPTPLAGNRGAIREAYREHGRAQARLFLRNLDGLADQKSTYSAEVAAILAPMLAVTESVSEHLIRQYGHENTSHALVCSWIELVESSTSIVGRRVVLFTTPAIAASTKLLTADCIANSDRIGWVGFPTVGASSLDSQIASGDNVELSDLCSSLKFKCLIHQYTHRGGKAMGSTSEGLSLSRFAGSKEDFMRNFATRAK